MSVLHIESIEVGEHSLEALVQVIDPALTRTSSCPGLAEKALSLLPELARHRCDNEANKRFVDEMRDTETPHLLEHITVELMALSGSPRNLPAHTEWDFARDGKGVFRVVVEHDFDLLALRALKDANTIVDWLFGQAPLPDIAAIVASLQKIRRQDAHWSVSTE